MVTCQSDGATKGLTTNLVFAITAAAFGSSWQFGYNIGVVNAPIDLVKTWINKTTVEQGGDSMSESALNNLWSLAVSIFCVGGVIGSLSTGFWVDKFGRKTTLLANNAVAILSGLLMGFCKEANSIEMLILGRFFVGLNAGLNSGAAPMYLSEISPVALRGAVSSIHQLVVTISILVSQILGLNGILGNEEGWPILFGLTCVPAFYQLMALPFCPESPRYLLINKDQEGRAQKALIKLRKTSEVYDEMDEMRLEHQEQQKETRLRFWHLFIKPDLRYILFIVAVIQASQQLTGINAVMYYSKDIFEDAGLEGDKAIYATIAMGVINVLMTIISVGVIEKAGRRTLHMTGLGVMAVTTGMLTVAMATKGDAGAWMSYLCVIFVILFVIGFATGPGSIPWFITAELFRQGARPAAMSIAAVCNWVANYLVGQAFLQLKDAMGPYVFLLFTGMNVMFLLFTFKFLPETRNRTIEEIYKTEFGNRAAVQGTTEPLNPPPPAAESNAV